MARSAPPTERAPGETGETADDPLPAPKEVPRTGFRARMRRTPGLSQAYRVGVFVLGLLFILLGIALATLPGPLTIPPVLLGLYIWSTEFAFAERLFDSFKEKGHEAWEHAKRHPVSSTIITVGGLALAGVAFWAISHYDLVDRGRDAIGI